MTSLPPRPAASRSVAAWSRPTAIASVQGSLALDLQPRLDPPVVPSGGTRVGADVVPISRPYRRHLEHWARRHLQAVVEIAAGDRPAHQLVRWCTPRVYADLSRRAQLVACAGNHRPGLGRPGPDVLRPQVQGLRACFLAPHIAEVSVRVRYGERSRALAARFERSSGRWLCSALDFS